MKLLLTGCTGFIGRVLIPLLIKEGHNLTVISRQSKEKSKAIANEQNINFIQMNPAESSSWDNEEIQNSLKSCEVIINLAGEPSAEKRWTTDHCKEIRNSLEFKENGINVNFVSKIDNDSYKVRTYERGVEDETFSCGTGVTASVIALNEKNLLNSNEIKVSTLGGDLKVKFEKVESVYKNIWLCGPATYVFKGTANV